MEEIKNSGSGVSRRRRFAAILLPLLVLGLLILFIYPKERVVGGLRGGPIGPGEIAYREDYTCIGIAYDSCPNIPDYGCDCLCFGMVRDRTCTLESYDLVEGITREPAACEGPARPAWGLPIP
jgi:hypothetical protein